MKLHENLRAKAAIRKTARTFGSTTAQSRAEMQAAIDAAWQTEDPAARAYWARLFPDGRKPTVEAFICRLAREVQSG